MSVKEICNYAQINTLCWILKDPRALRRLFDTDLVHALGKAILDEIWRGSSAFRASPSFGPLSQFFTDDVE